MGGAQFLEQERQLLDQVMAASDQGVIGQRHFGENGPRQPQGSFRFPGNFQLEHIPGPERPLERLGRFQDE